MSEKFKLKDISVVIPTYNRAKDFKQTIESFRATIPKINEVIIIDQSVDDLTKKLIKKIGEKHIKYYHSNTPSLTKARNNGISKVAKSSKIVLFIDDDVNIGEDYFENIIKTFNNYPEAMAVGAHHPREINESSLYRLAKRIFCLEHISTKEEALVLSTYGNIYPAKLSKEIHTQWLSGVNMAYKKGVFKEQLFDENLTGYALAEDFDFTYRLYKRHNNGLIMTPNAKVAHRFSEVERYPTKKIIYVNQINHFYLNFKNFNSSSKEKIIFIWTIFGISLLRSLQFLKNREPIDALKLKLFLSSLIYCIFNIRRIRKGKLEFE